MDPNNIRILIGEHDAIVALDMNEQLQRLGYLRPLQAFTLIEGLFMARDLRPDVIVLDANFQGATHGIELARDIHDNITIPTVFLAAFPSDILDNEHAIPRPFRYVTKPFIASEVHAAIQEMLS